MTSATRRTRARVLAGALALSLVAAACGNDDDGDAADNGNGNGVSENVLFGRQSIASTGFQQAGLPILDGDCGMHRQANFYAAQFADQGATFGEDGDVDVFYFPTMTDEFGQVTLVGGTYIVAFNDRPEVREVIDFLASPEYANARIETDAGGFLSPNQEHDTSLYSSELDQTLADILVTADPARFDGSDLMPSSVGAGSFWREGTEWVVGNQDLESFLSAVEASWPDAAEPAEDDGELEPDPEAEEIEGEGGAGRVTIAGPETGSEADGFTGSFSALPNEDIEIVYSGSRDFETQVRVAAEGGNLPDIGVIPQPGLVEDLAEFIVPVPQNTLSSYQDQYDEYLWDLVTIGGQVLGIPNKGDVKSLVWYSPSVFEENGYEIPETFDELLELQDQMRSDGLTPWCIGIESGDATGWVLTDWFEDMILRAHGPDVYDQWVANEIPFDDPRIVEVGEMIESIWFE
jgi:ABC-type glycerol-3-phosphate transport system substrate-binding protein